METRNYSVLELAIEHIDSVPEVCNRRVKLLAVNGLAPPELLELHHKFIHLHQVFTSIAYLELLETVLLLQLVYLRVLSVDLDGGLVPWLLGSCSSFFLSMEGRAVVP